MTTFEELKELVSEKAKNYLSETDTVVDKFPQSIVDFVTEYFTEQCHFPDDYTEKKIVGILEKYKYALSMACVEVFVKAGMEGQTSHTENNIVRQYKSIWISQELLSNLPNFVDIF